LLILYLIHLTKFWQSLKDFYEFIILNIQIQLNLIRFYMIFYFFFYIIMLVNQSNQKIFE